MQRQLDDSSSDDDASLIVSAAQILLTASNEKGPHGGSVKGHRVVFRDRQGGHDMTENLEKILVFDVN